MHPEVTITWDESSAEAVAKLRAMNEAGNVTWDLVDVVASDAIRLCDEGLAMEVDHRRDPGRRAGRHPASEDFGDLIVSDCFIPQIVYLDHLRLPHRHVPRAWSRRPTTSATIFDTRDLPGQARAGAAPDQQHGMGAALRRRREGRRLRRARDRGRPGPRASPSSTRSRTRRSGGPPAPTRRSCWPTARSSSARPTTAACSRRSTSRTSRSRCSGTRRCSTSTAGSSRQACRRSG